MWDLTKAIQASKKERQMKWSQVIYILQMGLHLYWHMHGFCNFRGRIIIILNKNMLLKKAKLGKHVELDCMSLAGQFDESDV